MMMTFTDVKHKHFVFKESRWKVERSSCRLPRRSVAFRAVAVRYRCHGDAEGCWFAVFRGNEFGISAIFYNEQLCDLNMN